MNTSQKHGFTLIEVSTAALLLVTVLTLVISGYMFLIKNINQADVQDELDTNVQLAIERLKKDLRLSSLDSMFYHPAGAGPYQAISFSMAEDSDGDGVLDQDATGQILWNKTVIYHIRPTTPNQLVKTSFKPRNSSLTDAQRQAQLESVVASGCGDSTFNGQNSSSLVIFKNLLNWKILPKGGNFDAYSPTNTRDSSSLGYILLDSGTHKFTFKSVGKNSKSSGYKIGIDQLFVSPSCSEREAEAQLPVSTQSGATVIAQYMPGDWKGNHHLYFPASASGHEFSLNLNNDQWEETNFGARGYEAENTEFIFDDTLSPKDFVTQLQGNDTTWDVTLQTETTIAYSTTNTALKSAIITVHINGSELATNGNWIVYNGRRCKLTFQASHAGKLQVLDVYIGKTTSQETTAFSFSEIPTSVKFSGSKDSYIMEPGETATSDWVDHEIVTTNNYLVLFRIKGDEDKCFPLSWKNLRTSIPECRVNGNPTNTILALAAITASYPENGKYTSQIFDTHLSTPEYGDLLWNADIPEGTSLSLKVRTGDQPDLSDAYNWDFISASTASSRAIAASYMRYIQFQALFTSDTNANNTSTPKLKDVTITWKGERQLVDIGGIFTKGPDYGIFSISVDGDLLRAALIVDLEIYKDVRVMNKESRRITSAIQADVTPRNSGK